MGPRVMRHLPKYVQGFIDRHGKARFYFRRAGFKTVALPGLPWSPPFMAAYEAALAGQPAQVGTSRVKPGTMWALAVSYFNSPEFRSLESSSRYNYRAAIERFCKQSDNGQQNGDKRVATLQHRHVVALMAVREPRVANTLRKALRAMMKHAVVVGLRADDPTRDVKAIAIKSSGHHTWSEAEIMQFEARHPIGSRAALALTLLLHTGQRRSDIIRMGRQHVRGDALYVRQQKTGVELLIPINAELRAAIDAAAAGDMTFLVTELGKPFTGVAFSNWFRRQCDMANLRHCSAHGLRKAAARRLAEAGCTPHEIAAITGHASLREIERYTRAVDQRRLAESAIGKTKARTDIVKPFVEFDKTGKKA
jgi:integrase